MDIQTNDDVLKSDFFSRLSKMIPHKQRDTGKFYPIPRNFRMNVKLKNIAPEKSIVFIYICQSKLLISQINFPVVCSGYMVTNCCLLLIWGCKMVKTH